ncbi:MAG: gliding motility lipoprotein GldH [Bacteroidales bacterium]|nr:gliding motility lipoprotein GldH [Candidatus Colimorpha merdihippi]
MIKYRLIIFVFVAVLLTQGCNRKVFYTHEYDVDEKGWNMNDRLQYFVDVEDTAQLLDFYVDVRNSINYPHANTFLFINTTFPDGSVAYDTLECPLADVEGHWYGKRTGRYVDGRYVFRRHVYMPQSGRYVFEIAHGLRDTNAVGLKSVGLHVEYAGK